MKGNTPLAKTTVNKICNNSYLAVIPFDDGSALEILLFKKDKNNIQPYTSKDGFIYNSVSEDIRLKISELIESM